MSIDKAKMKDVLTAFENDKFTDAKEILVKEIRKEKDAFLAKKLGLKESERIEPVPADSEYEEGEEEVTIDGDADDDSETNESERTEPEKVKNPHSEMGDDEDVDIEGKAKDDASKEEPK